MRYQVAVSLLLVAACSHSDATDKAKSAGSSADRTANAGADDGDVGSVDCAADISAADLKGLLAAPYKTIPLNVDNGNNGCGFQAEHFAAVRIYLVDRTDGETQIKMHDQNVVPMPGIGDKAIRGTSAFTNVIVLKGRGGCSIELAGVGNVDSVAELVPMSQEAREQKLATICMKLFAAKKL